jgi:hypothetical protein
MLQSEIIGGNFPEVIEIYSGMASRQGLWEHLTEVLQTKIIWDLCSAAHPTTNSSHCLSPYLESTERLLFS